jgi:hypothetical protein
MLMPYGQLKIFPVFSFINVDALQAIYEYS